MGGASLVNKSELTKGAWSKEEDEKLRAYIQRYGHWNWRQLPKFAGLLRCGKSCRLRWMNYLRPGLKRGNFSKEEEDLIVQLHEELGNKWSRIAAKLPGRTDNEIKNHWHTRLKKRGKQNQVTLKEKKQSSDISQSNINQKTTLEPQTSTLADDNTLFQLTTLEGFTVYQEATCRVSGVSCVSEDSSIVSLIDEESSGDFWSQPFVADSTFYHPEYGYPLAFTTEAGYNLSYASYGNDDGDMGFIYPMLQELLD